MDARLRWAGVHDKQNIKQNHSLFTNKHTSHVTKTAGIEVFLIPKTWERSRGNKSFS